MSSTMFNKPLDTEFVGKLNGVDERLDTLSEHIDTLNTKLNKRISKNLPTAGNQVTQTGWTLADIQKYRYITAIIHNGSDYGVPMTMPTLSMGAGESYFVHFREASGVYGQVVVDSTGTNVFYQLVGGSYIQMYIVLSQEI